MGKTTLLATVVLFGTTLSGVPIVSQAQGKQQTEPKSRQNLIREVRHQLVLLPYYSVFDNLAFRVEGDTVILEGQVVRPTLKSDAENVVKNIEGIGRGCTTSRCCRHRRWTTRFAERRASGNAVAR